jgi:hypothetical protein
VNLLDSLNIKNKYCEYNEYNISLNISVKHIKPINLLNILHTKSINVINILNAKSIDVINILHTKNKQDKYNRSIVFIEYCSIIKLII